MPWLSFSQCPAPSSKHFQTISSRIYWVYWIDYDLVFPIFPGKPGPSNHCRIFLRSGWQSCPIGSSRAQVHFGSRQQMKKGILHSLGRSQAADSCKSRADRLELVSGESDWNGTQPLEARKQHENNMTYASQHHGMASTERLRWCRGWQIGQQGSSPNIWKNNYTQYASLNMFLSKLRISKHKEWKTWIKIIREEDLDEQATSLDEQPEFYSSNLAISFVCLQL